MSTTDTKIPLAQALAAAQALADTLAPYCEQVLIAGSIRREKPEVGDLELVVIPRFEPVNDMFGLPVGSRSLLDDGLAIITPMLTYTKNGEKYKQFEWQGIKTDLFITTHRQWGVIATIRTGSADFSQWLMTQRQQGGAMPKGFRIYEGQLVGPAGPIATPTEQSLFETIGTDWVEPQERRDGRWRR